MSYFNIIETKIKYFFLPYNYLFQKAKFQPQIPKKNNLIFGEIYIFAMFFPFWVLTIKQDCKELKNKQIYEAGNVYIEKRWA